MPHRNNLMHKVTNLLLLLCYSSFRDVSLWHPLHINYQPGQMAGDSALLSKRIPHPFEDIRMSYEPPFTNRNEFLRSR